MSCHTSLQSWFVFLILFFFAIEITWAGQGWYILLPPVRDDKAAFVEKIVNTKAPLRQWEHANVFYRTAFDTAKDCDGALKQAGDLSQVSWRNFSQSMVDFFEKKRVNN